ncbi:restriction endonuclease [Micromonospora sp. NPDC005215]|uniref:restriction endonuclease n=1 Tax=Micromonospora sp. NPDC005215 TaxID=3157024 RepID=UPI0033A21D7A
MSERRSAAKRINPNAYNALADALAVVVWNKPAFGRLVRGLVRGAPELLADLDFDNDTKRETAGRLVDALMANETRYQELTISIMLNLAQMESFPNLEIQRDRDEKLAAAKAAVAHLRTWTKVHRSKIDEWERRAAEREAAARQGERVRTFSKSLETLKNEFVSMASATDPHKRGIQFEVFLNHLFNLFDLEPRASYSLEREQIDGAFSFDTDDYILEAKWWKGPIGRDQLDIFASKIRRKGKNALGLYISVNEFTSDAKQEFASATPFITMTGEDLYCILDERLRLDDVLRRKKRHMNETGNCYLPPREML